MSAQSVARSDAVQEGQLLSANVHGESVILTRVNGALKAYSGKCPHLGLPLAKGDVEHGVLTCKFHGASFDLATGQNIKWVDSVLGLPMPKFTRPLLAMGKSPCGLKHYQATEQDGQVFVQVV